MIKSLSVLVVDDEEDIRILLQLWLQEMGHQSDQAVSAKGAVPLVRQKAFDLVVTDVLMPEGDGLELIEALKTALPSARVIAMSGGGRYIEGENCLKIARGWGAHATLMKPFTRETFAQAMAQAFAPPPAPGW